MVFNFNSQVDRYILADKPEIQDELARQAAEREYSMLYIR